MGGQTCLEVAIRQQHHRLLVQLLEYGLSPNIQNAKNGDTALHVAVCSGSIKIVKMLLSYDADPRLTNAKGETPLRVAEQQQLNDADLNELSALLETSDSRGSMSLDDSVSQSRSLSLKSLDLSGVDHTLSPESVASVMEPSLSGPFECAADNLKEIETGKLLRGLGSSVTAEQAQRLIGTQRLLNDEDALPTLEGWLMRSDGGSVPNVQWTRQWLMVRRSYVLWDDRERRDDPKDRQQRKEFKGCVNLMQIAGIDEWVMAHAEDYAFCVRREGTRKRHSRLVWRCADREERDRWVDGLRRHREHIQRVVHYLGTK